MPRVGQGHDRRTMAYRITLERDGCFNCGACMDLCPVHALDMSRPTRPGIEAGAGSVAGASGVTPWMMEYPVQVGTCVGCGICVRECPVQVLGLSSETGWALAPVANLAPAPEPPTVGWIPLSGLTREVLRDDHVSPWSPLNGWVTADRAEPWQVWRTWGERAAPPLRAPCQEACPAGTDAGRYIGLLADGRYDEAFAVAAEVNPFASVCGYICTAPCETVCRRGVLDEPIAIRTLKRAAAELGQLPSIDAPTVRRSERVAVVGGGPAGMSAAYFLARLGYRVSVLEAQPVPGGMMAIGIPEYRLPKAILRAEIERIVDLGVELRLGVAMGRDFSLLDLEREGFAAVFIATGASRSRRLGVPGEELAGVLPATVFLRDVNIGPSPRLAGPAVVVGGGSTAMDAARSAWRAGASPVTVLYRRGRSEMPAQVEEIEAAEAEGVVIREAMAVAELRGRDGRLTKIAAVEQRRAGSGPDGRAHYEPIPGSRVELEASAFLVAIGEEPDPSILPEGSGIEISSWAGIIAHPRTLQTGRIGVFAGGDVVTGPRSVIEAVANGRRAAASVHGYLAGVADPESELFATVRRPTPAAPELVLRLGASPRSRQAPLGRDGDPNASVAGFDERTARAEADRCLRCDALYSSSRVRLTAAVPADADSSTVAPAASTPSPGTFPGSSPPTVPSTGGFA